MDILNKPTERGYLAYAHTSRVATTYQHWPKEIYENNQAELPTLRVLSYVQNIARAELEHMPSLQAPKHIARSIRAASKEVDGIRTKQRQNIPRNVPLADYTKQLRNQCQPLNFSDWLVKYLAPLWGEGALDWTPFLEKHTTLAGHTKVHILHLKSIHAKLKRGHHHRISNNLELALSTFRTTLILPTAQKHRELPKPTTHKATKYTYHGSNT